MTTLSPTRLRLVALLLLATGATAIGSFVALRDRGDPRLTPFATAGLDYPVVFTSRSEPMSLRAAADRRLRPRRGRARRQRSAAVAGA